MSFSGDFAEQARSMEFFTDPKNYGQFYLNSHNQRTYGCIDPRDEARATLHVIMQTAGGAAGLAYDQTMAYAAHKGNGVDLAEGVTYDSQLRKVTVATGHHACAFLNSVAAVNAEIADPSAMTLDTLGRLAARYGLDERTTFHADIKRIQDTAKRNQDVLANTNPGDFLKATHESYPHHENIGAMRGDNHAGIYIFNHHPYVGLDRSKVHRSAEPLSVQAYHSSTKASLEGLLGLTLPRELKNLRLAAFILREAATPTVLVGDDPRVRFLHIVPSVTASHGLQFEEQYRAA